MARAKPPRRGAPATVARCASCSRCTTRFAPAFSCALQVPPVAQKSAEPFFVLIGSGRQIRRIDQGDPALLHGPPLQDALEKVLVDLAQNRRRKPLPKLMELPHIRQAAPIGQMSKPPPSVLLGKQLTEQIARSAGREQQQQRHAKQLR